MILGIVGHAAEKFTKETEKKAKEVLRMYIEGMAPHTICSGRSPMGGVDVWAEEIAEEMGLKTLIFPPKVHTWGGEGGFKDRNMKIVEHSDYVACLVVRDLPDGYKGMKFKDCYHCKGRNPPHVKSGGCWTTWKAKDGTWLII